MLKKSIAIVCLVLAAAVAFAELKNGVFTAREKAADERGYTAEIRLTINAGKIEKIDYNEANKAGVSKWTDKGYNANMKKISGISWIDAVLALENDLIKKQATAKVDVVSGATELTVRFKALAAEALLQATLK